MKLLHVGCGGHPCPEWLKDYTETRLDIDPDGQPHIVASMTAMGDIGQYDMIFCSHALEHLYPHQIEAALGEFMRVLVPGGCAVIAVPDLEGVQATDDALYMTADGPVTGHDLIYGLAPTVKASLHMAHHTGFIEKTMTMAMNSAGFSKIVVKRCPYFNLLAIGVK